MSQFAKKLVQFLGEHTDIEVSFSSKDGKTILNVEGGVSIKDAFAKFAQSENYEEREEGLSRGSSSSGTTHGVGEV